MKKIKTHKIGQNEYVDVSERIKHFWELHPNWSIITLIEKVDLESGVVIIKAWVEDETGRVRSTGHAHEFQADKKSRVNMTSFVENCETSAIGRALGTLGIGTEHGIASAFEVQLAKEKEAEMNGVIPIVTDPPKKKVEDEKSADTSGEQKVVLEAGDKTLTKDASQEQLDALKGKTPEKEEEVLDIDVAKLEEALNGGDKDQSKLTPEEEQEYLVDLNRRVSTLKNSKDAKTLAEEGRKWSDNWTYKKDEYQTLYKCISESFATFKRSEDQAKSANLKGGS